MNNGFRDRCRRFLIPSHAFQCYLWIFFLFLQPKNTEHNWNVDKILQFANERRRTVRKVTGNNFVVFMINDSTHQYVHGWQSHSKKNWTKLMKRCIARDSQPCHTIASTINTLIDKITTICYIRIFFSSSHLLIMIIGIYYRNDNNRFKW